MVTCPHRSGNRFVLRHRAGVTRGERAQDSAGRLVPLVVGTGLFILMRTWRKGMRLLSELAHRGRPPLSEFIRNAESSLVPRVPGTAIFLTGNAADVPAALLHNMKHNKVLHDQNVILTVVTEEVPRLGEEGRVTVEELSDRFSRVTVRFGFMEDPNVPKALERANFSLENVSFFLSRRALQPSPTSGLPLWQDYLLFPWPGPPVTCRTSSAFRRIARSRSGRGLRYDSDPGQIGASW